MKMVKGSRYTIIDIYGQCAWFGRYLGLAEDENMEIAEERFVFEIINDEEKYLALCKADTCYNKGKIEVTFQAIEYSPTNMSHEDQMKSFGKSKSEPNWVLQDE